MATTESPQVDADSTPGDDATAHRAHWWDRKPTAARSVGLVAVTTVVGAVLGWASVSVPGPMYQSSALVNAGPGATIAQTLDISTDQANRFVQTELVAFTSEDTSLDDAVRDRLGLPEAPTITATQVGQTDIIDISASDRDPATAARIAETAAEVYVEGWRVRAADEVTRTLTAVNAQIDDASAALDRLPPTGGTPSEEAQRDALVVEYAELLKERAELNRQQQAVKTSERIVSPATADTATRVSSPNRMALLGGALGFLVGVVVVLVLYRRNTRGRRVWDL